ncbi:SNF2 family N-terminal domain-containing protein [Boeremia exigua]|uniref:SNF2 family N-terminal domain-containing protein n=1 Tax=Boeremia exigua TaxID=749465 RepID=UPI001E8CDA23|nr:SNF2 family N-terminal domain-containing protein [Boeremia exigua]KAH6638133.1 SNF2 family N-terminal domain-containing protein [Boeremia exigua]
MYPEDPIMSSSPPPAANRTRSSSPDKQTYVTQPTQPLPARSPYFASDVTQPTQLLTPKAHRTLPIELGTSPALQVPRSSPGLERFSSPAHEQSQPQYAPRPHGFNPMAPPGTGFYPPQAVRKPVFDLTSDDAPVERDPDEDETSFRSNIPLSKVEMGTRALRVEETPPKPASWDLSGYAYTVVQQASRKRGGEFSQSPPSKKAKPLPRQGGPSRAMPVAEEREMALSDIHDFDLRRKTTRLQVIFGSKPISVLYEALVRKKGHFEDASSYLLEQDSDDELLKSPQIGVAQRSASTAEPKKTAQRKLNAPVKSLMDKYSKQAPTYNTPSATASPTTTDAEQPKKRRLIRGRRNFQPESDDEPMTPPRPQTKVSKPPAQAPIVVSDDEDEGIIAISDNDSDAGVASEKEHTFSEDKLLDFFNECSVEAMIDLSNHKEEDIAELLKQRPFKSLDAVRKVHVDAKAKEEQEKGKKKARKPRITSGARLVESAEEMWDAYSTIDSVVKQCEGLGKPMVAGMARWGINIFGASTDGEVDAVALDDSSDTSSTRDSGYHTPKSGHGSDNETDLRKTSSKLKLLKQPAIMNKDVELKDYQVVGLNWLNLLWQNGISGILADDMGLGKTCQVIAFLSHLKEQGEGRPTLIVVPGSTLENWCREFERFSSKVNFTPYYGSQAERFESQDTIRDNIETGNCDVIITTYDLAYRKEDNAFLRRCKPQICIFDEGHVLKNANTARYKSLMRITPKCRILLTGTPLQNSLQELMSILGFLMPDVFYDKQDDSVQEMLQILFKHKAKVTESTSHSTLLSAQRVQRARTMLTPFILRRKKAQVLKHLPKKTCRVEYCELTDTQKTLYNEQLQKQRKILLDRAAGLLVKDHANVMMKLRQAAIHPLLFRHRYTDDKIRKMSKACLREETFAESNPDIIYEELQLYQDYQCHHLALKYPRALKKFELKDREWMDSGKVQTLLKLIKQYQANGDRALVFSQFTSVMDILGWVFDDADIPFMRMDGSTPIAERQGLLDVFHGDAGIPVFMLSTKSGGAGINLACANKVVVFDGSFNPQDDVQAENRAHRVGQTREVEVVRLVTAGTVEEQIYALGVSKLELDKMVQGEEAEDAPPKGRKKGAVATGSGTATPALTKADQAGISAVEAMLLQQMVDQGEKVDVKDAFRMGLESAGLDVGA